MSSVGFRGVGWLIVLCSVGCGATHGPPARHAAKVAPAQVDAAVREQPPLTPAPPGSVDTRVTTDLKRLSAAVTAGTGARIAPGWFTALWELPGVDLELPIMVGISDGSSSNILSASIRPGAVLSYGPTDAELAAQGLKLLGDGYCAARESGAGAPAVACAPRALLLSSADDLLRRGRNLGDGRLVELQVSLTPGPSSGVHEWRKAAMRQVDALLPDGSALSEHPALRLGLLDLSFEFVDRLVDSYKRLGPLNVEVSQGRADAFEVSASVAPGAGSVLARAVAAAQDVRIPAAFWDLPEHTEQALSFDGSLVAPLLESSQRTQSLLAEVRSAGSLAEAVLAVPAACARTGRAWTLAQARPRVLDAQPVAAEERALPQLSDGGPAAVPRAPAYTLLGIEDAPGTCIKALRGLLVAYERSARVAGRAPDAPHLNPLPTNKALPPTVKLFRLGAGEDATHVALAERKGVLWLGSSSDLRALESGLSELLSSSPQRRGLRSRSELAEWGSSAALVAGFVGQDALPFFSFGVSQGRSRQRPERLERDGPPRVVFAMAKEQSRLRVSGRLDAPSLRRSFAGWLFAGVRPFELRKLPAAKLEPALGMLEAACRLGSGEACNALGVAYGDGRGVAKDVTSALHWLEAGCAQDSGAACANMALYKTTTRAEQLELLQKGCELDAAFGCAWWGVKLLESDVPADHWRGFEKLAFACNRHVAFACARIGNHYQHGIGLPHDDSRGADFHERACELGLGGGCVGVATALATGKGRKQDAAAAFKQLQRACELDKQEGCYALGLAHLYGQLTTKDEAAGRRELAVACEANHADACRVLAELSEEP